MTTALEDQVAVYRTLPPQQRTEMARQASNEMRKVLAWAERQMAMERSPGSMAAVLTGGREWQARHLDLIDKAFIRIANGERMRVLLNMPPRHGKSVRAARWAPLWYLARHPDHRVMIASYAAKLAEGHGRWIRDAIRAHGPEIGIQLRYGSQAANRFDLEDTAGGLVTAGVGGSLTGMGANVAIVDDPLKDAKEADSPVKLANLWDWWQQVVNTRMEPNGSIIVIQTRWSQNDLAGRILQDGARGWTVLNLPAVAMTEGDPLGRAIGEPLWPERFRRKHLRRFKKDVGERGWWALYQQEPRPLEGGVWKWPWITENRITPQAFRGVDLTRTVVAIDTAGGREDSDEVGIVGAGRDAAGEIYVLADRSKKMGAAEWGRTGCLLAIELQADAFVVESNFGGDMAAQILRQAWAELEREGVTKGLLMPRIIEVTAKVGKRLRAEPVAQIYENGHAHHVGEFPGLEVQYVSWIPGMDSPDRLDAAVHAITELADPTQQSIGGSSYADNRLGGRR
ncbi:terminase family protein [Streptomyces scabiei]|uniref:terminase large subunit domain-containing protein n=1 Tax=Streptomyces scabiei TaxID=1930 RepID=UPI000765CBBA|nr:terminase family protein [Streptomyces scabiei]MDX2999344.1 terminase family protein [Streptomyces scabiei]MDX3052915.1 terminase family protein [Streptomyces scabiei]MDX3178997.1 terminase family protein [Streptomyces scabiei]